MKGMSLGLQDALRLVVERLKPLPAEEVGLVDSVERIAASDLYAVVDSPSMDSSRKDGYAVIADEVADATPLKPVRLKLLGSMAAGCRMDIKIEPGTTVRVLTGAPIPTGADAVVAEEFVKRQSNDVLVESFAEPKNILLRGSDVALRKRVLQRGQKISPVMAGLLAAAGHCKVPVVRNPFVGIIGTGDEVVEPGKTLANGELYASNGITLASWCAKYRMKTLIKVVKDDHNTILNILKIMSQETDALITSGGAWTGDHDMVAGILEELGWTRLFHRIRIGPGKAVGFGMLDTKPVFILAGSPPSNLMGFLQIALPGLLALSGHTDKGLPITKARLASEIRESEPDWTEFFFGTLEPSEGLPVFYPMKKRSRLSSIAEATAIASIPEGQVFVSEGSIISVQSLN